MVIFFIRLLVQLEGRGFTLPAPSLVSVALNAPAGHLLDGHSSQEKQCGDSAQACLVRKGTHRNEVMLPQRKRRKDPSPRPREPRLVPEVFQRSAGDAASETQRRGSLPCFWGAACFHAKPLQVLLQG